MNSAIIWNTNTKRIYINIGTEKMKYKKKCAGQHTVDLINNNISKIVFMA